jgi:hypothetical protein
MSGRAGAAVLAFVSVLFAGDHRAWSQLSAIPTPLPTVTAENESWYVNGEPIAYAGSLYYPSGAQVYFNATEMVRSGFFMGIPLYTRTTIEPYSIVYVPLPNGRMQPYARPRTGELTGTAASTPSSELPRPPATVPPPGLAAQAAGPPAATTQTVPVQIPRPPVVEPAPPVHETPPVGTTGRPATHTRIGGRPEGTQSIFVEYDGRRWYPQGPPQRLDPKTMERIGTYRGFEVWARRGDRSVIYIPVTVGAVDAVAYSQTRPKERLQ